MAAPTKTDVTLTTGGEGLAPRLRSFGRHQPEVVIAILALVLASQVVMANAQYWPLNVYHLNWLVYLSVGLLMMYRFGWTWLVWAGAHCAWLLPVLTMALLSTLWSPEPWLTFSAATALVGTTLVGFFIGYAIPPRTLMVILVWVFAAIMIVNVSAAVLYPSYGILPMRRGYLPIVWQGAVRNKNELGMLAAIALALFTSGTITRRLRPVAGGMLSLLASVTLFMAQAATAIVAALSGAGLLVALWIAKRVRLPALVMVLIIAIAGLTATPFLLADPALLSEPLHRDATLTKRTVVWQDALRVLAESPLLGHGYQSVWGHGRSTWFPYVKTTSWAGHAHNAYLQLATDLGVPTALVGIAYLVRTTYAALQVYLMRFGSFSLFALVFLPMCLILNGAETYFFRPYNLLWVIFVAVGTAAMRLLYPEAPARLARAGPGRGRQRSRDRLGRAGRGGAREPSGQGREIAHRPGPAS